MWKKFIEWLAKRRTLQTLFLLRYLKRIEGKEDAMIINLETLIAEIEQTKGAVDSVIVFISDLKTEIAGLKDLIGDPAALQAKIDELAATLDAEQQRIAAAIATEPPPA